MKPPFVPIPVEALHARLSAAGFRAIPNSPDDAVYELSHHRDPRYVVRVHSSLHRDDGSVSAVALQLAPDTDVVFNGPPVERRGTVEEVLDRVIEGARDAYAAINRRRLAARLGVQAHEVAVRGRRSDLRRRSG